MTDRSFRLELLLAVLIPILVTFLAVRLSESMSRPQSQSMDSLMQSSFGDSVHSMIRIAGDDAPLPASKPKSLGNMELSLAMALIIGLAALFGHYVASRWLWYIMVTLSLVFTIMGAAFIGIKLTAFFIPNLLLTAALTYIVQKVFFNPSLLRVRMLICSIAGAIAVMLYFRVLYIFTNLPFTTADWQTRFVGGLINLIFVFFGMSVSDLIITRIRYSRLPLQPPSDDEDEDAD